MKINMASILQNFVKNFLGSAMFVSQNTKENTSQDVQAMSISEKKFFENVTMDLHRAAAASVKGRAKKFS